MFTYGWMIMQAEWNLQQTDQNRCLFVENAAWNAHLLKIDERVHYCGETLKTMNPLVETWTHDMNLST